MTFSKITHDLKGQKMFQILQQAKELERQGREIIHLEIGDPDFDSPKIAIDAIKRHLDNNETHYAPSTGLYELKDASRNTTLASRGFRPDLDQILVTSGANIQIYLACACLLDPNDEIVICDPCFVSYQSIVRSLHGVPVPIKLCEKNNFAVDTGLLRAAISEKTKAVIINSPHNPTGSIVSEAQWREIFRICEEYDIFLISDEVYGRMIYSDSNVQFFSPSSIDKCKERTILIHSFSKTYSMTGWRIGAVTAPNQLIEKMGLLFETINSCVPPFIQLAAADLLNMARDSSQVMMGAFEERRNLICDRIDEFSSISCNRPNGAFYVFANIQNTRLSSEQFCEVILEKVGVAACPGNFFGSSGEGFVRFCFANSNERINYAFDRIAGLFK
ncbi:aminotransferase class I/II-fold pyridoxal phosphate-dependent enzyme [Luminiphilus sp.]|nr:aminotransferase class I/II-fold pyridoxal phosphate-dependent enzyme [Luminiphilus sp.]